MAIAAVTANTTALASAINAYRDHLQGEAASTEAWFLRCSTGNDFIIVLADAAGARKVSFRDSANVEVASIDSDGNLVVNSTTFTTLISPVAASPAQTAEGSIVWDSDDDRLTVGTGAATKVVGLSRGAGLAASATQELAYDTTAATLQVWDGSASQRVSGAWIHIDTQVLTGTATSVSFASLNTAYKVFRLTINDISQGSHNVVIRLNNDSAGNYDWQSLTAVGAALTGVVTAAASEIRLYAHVNTGAAAYGSAVVVIAKEVASSKAMLTSVAGLSVNSGDVRIQETQGIWHNTADLISRIDVILSANNFNANTRITLEGMQITT